MCGSSVVRLQVCGKPVTSGNQKILQPPGSARLVVMLHDIDLVRPDKYATAQLHAFLEHALQHGGFYDAHLDFVALRRTHIIATAATADGGVPLPPRLARMLHTLALAAPGPSEATEALAPRARAAVAAAGAPSSLGPSLAAAALQLLSSFSEVFGRHSAAHYAVSLHDAAAVLEFLPLYDWGDSVSALSAALANEARLRFLCRLQTPSERIRCEGLLQDCVSALDGSPGTLAGDFVYTTLGAASADRLTQSDEPAKLCCWSISDFHELVRPPVHTRKTHRPTSWYD